MIVRQLLYMYHFLMFYVKKKPNHVWGGVEERGKWGRGYSLVYTTPDTFGNQNNAKTYKAPMYGKSLYTGTYMYD